MNSGPELCSLCAWRENCKKKFSISGKDVKCPDFVKDVSIKDAKKSQEAEKKT